MNSGLNTNLINLFISITCLSILISIGIYYNTPTQKQNTFFEIKDPPIPLKMYYAIETECSKHMIPRHIAYNIAYMETRYRGPFDIAYKHNLISSVGALGPMQVMASTAEFITKTPIDNDDLLYDVNVNVNASIRLLKYLHDKYGSWEIACSYYNTGKKCINNFGVYCANNIDYQSKWVNYSTINTLP